MCDRLKDEVRMKGSWLHVWLIGWLVGRLLARMTSLGKLYGNAFVPAPLPQVFISIDSGRPLTLLHIPQLPPPSSTHSSPTLFLSPYFLVHLFLF